MDKNNYQIEKHWHKLVLSLKEIVKEKNLMQKDLAEKTGFRQQNISRILNLEYCPNLNTFIAICKAANVTLTELEVRAKLMNSI